MAEAAKKKDNKKDKDKTKKGHHDPLKDTAKTADEKADKTEAGKA